MARGSIPRNNEISSLYGCNCRCCKFDRRPVLIRAISQCPDESRSSSMREIENEIYLGWTIIENTLEKKYEYWTIVGI